MIRKNAPVRQTIGGSPAAATAALTLASVGVRFPVSANVAWNVCLLSSHPTPVLFPNSFAYMPSAIIDACNKYASYLQHKEEEEEEEEEEVREKEEEERTRWSRISRSSPHTHTPHPHAPVHKHRGVVATAVVKNRGGKRKWFEMRCQHFLFSQSRRCTIASEVQL